MRFGHALAVVASACPYAGEASAAAKSCSCQRPTPDPPHDLELSVEMLDHRGAAFDPVAAIDVAQADIVAYHGMMDVAADDPVEAAAAPRFRRERALVLPDEGHRVLDFQLGPFGQRPIGQAERAPDRVEIGIDPDGEV